MWISLSKVIVTAAGTPVRATANQAEPAIRFSAHAILFQQVAGNTGKLYICDRSNAVKATGVGVLAVLAVPTANILPSASCTVTAAPAAFNVNEVWLDADVSGEGCQVSVIRA